LYTSDNAVVIVVAVLSPKLLLLPLKLS